MTGLVFVDTNVHGYARDPNFPAKETRALEWLDALWEERTGRISYQVLIEYFRVATQKLKPSLPVATARADIRALLTWNPVAPSAELLERRGASTNGSVRSGSTR